MRLMQERSTKDLEITRGIQVAIRNELASVLDTRSANADSLQENRVRSEVRITRSHRKERPSTIDIVQGRKNLMSQDFSHWVAEEISEAWSDGQKSGE